MAGEKIRVLIVDDIADTRENIRKLLQFENDIEVIGGARSGKEAIEVSRDAKPDVVLMDINMPDIDGITATEIIRRNNQAIQVVILSVQGDPNYMRRAMLAGARDFLTKPPAADELTSAIRRAGKMAQDERLKANLTSVTAGKGATSSLVMTPVTSGKIIVVYSPKGGTGCTTLAVNLAMSLHNEETQVALVDGNLQFGDVTVFLNVQAKNSAADLASHVDELDQEMVNDVLVTHSNSGVKILPAPARPEQAEDVSGEQFGKLLNFLRCMFSYVVIDTSSILTDVVLAAMDSADIICLITTQDIPSIKNARLYLDLAQILKIKRRRILFVMNRYDKRIGITAEKVSESFKHEIVAVIPLDERTVVPSINRGIPFLLGDRSKPLSRSVLSLAETVRQRLAEMAESEIEKEMVVTRKTDKR